MIQVELDIHTEMFKIDDEQFREAHNAIIKQSKVWCAKKQFSHKNETALTLHSIIYSIFCCQSFREKSFLHVMWD